MATRPFRFGVVAATAPSGEVWLAKARRVEELGYATLLIPDRLGPLLAPLPALAAAAAATRTLHLGTFVLAGNWRNPTLLARDCATLHLLSGGRFEAGFGAGVGGDDAARAGLPVEAAGARITSLAATLGAVKGLFAGQATAGHRGALPPYGGTPPRILIAAAGRRSLALAAREADIVTFSLSPAEPEGALAGAIEVVRREAGARFADLELSTNLAAVVGAEPLPPHVAGRLRALFGLELDAMVRNGSPFVLAGTPDAMCAQLLDRRERLGISYVSVPDDMLEVFAPVVARLGGR